jgi:hypothetical protein
MVRVNLNRIDDYLEGLKQTWVSGYEELRTFFGEQYFRRIDFK